jgi:hypothetical protein
MAGHSDSWLLSQLCEETQIGGLWRKGGRKGGRGKGGGREGGSKVKGEQKAACASSRDGHCSITQEHAFHAFSPF